MKPQGEILLKSHKKQSTYFKKALKILEKTKCFIKEINYINNDIIIKYEVGL